MGLDGRWRCGMRNDAQHDQRHAGEQHEHHAAQHRQLLPGALHPEQHQGLKQLPLSCPKHLSLYLS